MRVTTNHKMFLQINFFLIKIKSFLRLQFVSNSVMFSGKILQNSPAVLHVVNHQKPPLTEACLNSKSVGYTQTAVPVECLEAEQS